MPNQNLPQNQSRTADITSTLPTNDKNVLGYGLRSDSKQKQSSSLHTQPGLQRQRIAEPSRCLPPGTISAVGKQIDNVVRASEGIHPCLRGGTHHHAPSAQQPGGQGRLLQRPIAVVHPKVLRESAERGGHVVGCVERQILSCGRLGKPNLEDLLDLLNVSFLVKVVG